MSGSVVLRVFQARILEWVVISFSNNDKWTVSAGFISGLSILLYFDTNFKYFCFSFVKNAFVNLIGIASNLSIALGNMVILTVLILPIQEHGISFHLFVSSSVSSSSGIVFREQVFCLLGRFIPRYFILFDAVVNGIFPLISLPDLLLLVW